MAPDGQTFRTTHSSVIDEGSRDRIVVLGRSSTGDGFYCAAARQLGGEHKPTSVQIESAVTKFEAAVGGAQPTEGDQRHEAW